jgi:hypothetical protein
MEALAAGALLATVPTPGSFEALPLARELAPALVAADVAAPPLDLAVRAAFAMNDAEVRAYRERALTLLEPYREEAVARVVATEVLPALGVAPR